MMLKSHPLGCSIPLSGKLQLMAPFLKCLRPIEWALLCDGNILLYRLVSMSFVSYLISVLLLFLVFLSMIFIYYCVHKLFLYMYMQDADKECDALLWTILNFKADNLLI